MTNWFRGWLGMVVALLVLGVSSQAAVCELACGLQVSTVGCHHAAPVAAGHDMRCDHEAATPHDLMAHAVGHESMTTNMVTDLAVLSHAASCHDASCSHTVVPVFAKDTSTATIALAVEWVAVGVVPHEVRPLRFERRPPVRLNSIDPLIVSLRV